MVTKFTEEDLKTKLFESAVYSAEVRVDNLSSFEKIFVEGFVGNYDRGGEASWDYMKSLARKHSIKWIHRVNSDYPQGTFKIVRAPVSEMNQLETILEQAQERYKKSGGKVRYYEHSVHAGFFI